MISCRGGVKYPGLFNVFQDGCKVAHACFSHVEFQSPRPSMASFSWGDPCYFTFVVLIFWGQIWFMITWMLYIKKIENNKYTRKLWFVFLIKLIFFFYDPTVQIPQWCALFGYGTISDDFLASKTFSTCQVGFVQVPILTFLSGMGV